MKSASAACMRCIIFGAILFSLIPASPALSKSPGQVRALIERGDTVSQRKNRFVATVLNQHGIGYTLDRHGVVNRINFTGDWIPVARIDVVPMLRKGPEIDEVIGHEVYIYTHRETVRLVSYLKAR